MRCSICQRPLLHCAVPGLAIGPKCARDRGLVPEPARRMRLFGIRIRSTTSDPAQADWINLINAGAAGESALQ